MVTDKQHWCSPKREVDNKECSLTQCFLWYFTDISSIPRHFQVSEASAHPAAGASCV